MSSPPTLWDRDISGLHDAWWSSRGVRIVRRGCAPDRGRGPALLLEPHQLLLAELPPVGRGRGRTRCCRIIEPGAGYAERVDRDADGRVRSVRRTYDTKQTAGLVVMTNDPRLVDAWSNNEDGIEWDARTAAGFSTRSECDLRGLLLDAGNAGDEVRCRNALLESWTRPARHLMNLRRVQPGIWAHRSARIDPSARLVGPVWIGAGQTVSADAVVIGPTVLPDQVSAGDVALRPRPALPPRSPRPRRPELPGKRLFDIAVALVAGVLALPLLPIIAFVIMREDGGPVLFRHTRQTKGGRPFSCWKFRTMRRDAEAMKRALHERNICDGPQFHIADDPRLLRCGRTLRRFHLDEVPQLLNVLRGDMSIVGPRPSPDEENQFCPAWRELRLSVRPGMTGLWQVRRTRRPGADFQEWIRYDVEYVTQRSWRLDLEILWTTAAMLVTRVLSARGARAAEAEASTVLVEPKDVRPVEPIIAKIGPETAETTSRAAA